MNPCAASWKVMAITSGNTQTETSYREMFNRCVQFVG
jgi:hypothetical protein